MNPVKDTLGIAILTKTPGLSSIKTRLEATIGKARAEAFHLFSALAVEETVLDTRKLYPKIYPYWSIAEQDGDHYPHWKNLTRIYQGGGEFGRRLRSTYNQLLQRHENAIFVVSDSPLLSVDLLLNAVQVQTSQGKVPGFVLGPSPDGGFYLFGGNKILPDQFWLDVPYSCKQTAMKLMDTIRHYGDLNLVAPLPDVDTEADLEVLYQSFTSSPHRLNGYQQQLFDWLIDHRGKRKQN